MYSYLVSRLGSANSGNSANSAILKVGGGYGDPTPAESQNGFEVGLKPGLRLCLFLANFCEVGKDVSTLSRILILGELHHRDRCGGAKWGFRILRYAQLRKTSLT